MKAWGVWVYIVAWAGSGCFGFDAPLNEPHAVMYVCVRSSLPAAAF